MKWHAVIKIKKGKVLHPKYLYKKTNNNLPLAIHAWWRYDKLFVEKLIKSQTDAEEK